VTGSTLHSAIGLRGLKEQKNHFEKFIEGQEMSVTAESECRMQHGLKHDIDALATLIGRFLPAFYPDAVFIEEGCYIIPGTSVDVLGVVSPDGSIRSSLPTTENKVNSVIAAIEIQCPFLYVSYSETSTTGLKVSLSPDLWDIVWNEAVELYDVDTVPKPTKSRPNTKEIKGRIKDFVITNVQMLCELPSCKISIDRVITSVAENV
jgi:hypothetical protein